MSTRDQDLKIINKRKSDRYTKENKNQYNELTSRGEDIKINRITQ